MKIDKHGNSYRIRKMIDGKSRTITFDHKPTQREIVEALHETYDGEIEAYGTTFRKACEQYCDMKRNVLSPATMREYDRTCGRLPEWFVKLDISEIGQATMQRLVNELSTSLSAKTVKDRHAFCVGVIQFFNPSAQFHTTLPKKADKEPYIPSHDDVKRILDNSCGTMFHVPLQLACYGLRREEICALTKADLDGDILTINKALVQDTDKNWVIKTTKTKDSTRKIAIDEKLADEIRAIDGDKIYNGFPESISNYLKRTQKKLGIENFSVHKLRHYFCTTLAENGVAENDILAMGGWKQNSDVMKRVYRHSNLEREQERMRSMSSILKNARS